jgi:hypothetical protein
MCRRGLFGAALLSVVFVSPAARAEPARGDVVFRGDFEGPQALHGWDGADDGGVSLVPGFRDSQSLRIERPAEEKAGHRAVRAALPLDKVRGTRLLVEVMARAEDVARPPHAYNGVKCMLHTVAPAGPRWTQQDNLFGTFDWKPLRFVAEVPADATEAELVLGLEETTGRVWFDDLKLTVVGVRRRAPERRPSGPVWKGHDLPQLRGAMISPSVTAEDLRVLGRQWHANHVRWQLDWGGFPRGPADKADLAAYDAWLESALKRLDELLPVCREAGLLVLIDLHTPPGGRNDASECRLFHDKRLQDHFVDLWEKMARRYRGNATVWGYDLVNEPVEGVVDDGLLDWHALAERTAKAVRAIDPDHALVIEPAPWGDPHSLDWFEPLDVPGVVYSVHMYSPHKFTHQGVGGGPTGITYPGPVDGRQVGKEQLRQALAPAAEYQRVYNVAIYVGEFSAIRWAPDHSAFNYLRDVIDILEEQGWDWAYHAFREWDGWSVEHGPDPNDHAPSKTPTDREQLLRSCFARNARPGPGREDK